MPDTTGEAILKALLARLVTHAPAGSVVVRNETLPTRIPDGGWICLRDGDPGDPEFLMSPPTWVFDHVAEVDVLVGLTNGAARDAQFDAIKQAVSAALMADTTLGGRCDYVRGMAPVIVEIPIEGRDNIKAATIGVVLTYGSPDPLG